MTSVFFVSNLYFSVGLFFISFEGSLEFHLHEQIFHVLDFLGIVAAVVNFEHFPLLLSRTASFTGKHNQR